MGCLNDHITRAANKEGQYTGQFTESRYTSQALIDEKTLATCMADKQEDSEHTSVKN